jgi:hypothetical protein
MTNETQKKIVKEIREAGLEVGGFWQSQKLVYKKEDNIFAVYAPYKGSLYFPNSISKIDKVLRSLHLQAKEYMQIGSLYSGEKGNYIIIHKSSEPFRRKKQLELEEIAKKESFKITYSITPEFIGLKGNSY